MEEKVSPFKPALKSGLILAFVGIIISLIVWVFSAMESMGLMGSLYLGLLNLTIVLVLLVLFTKSYRDDFLEKKITYGKAFIYGLLVVVFYSFFSGIYNYIFNAFIDPEYIGRVMGVMQDKTVEMLEKRGAGEDAINEVLIKFEEQGIPGVWEQLRSTLMFGVIGGAIMSLISSAIVKKDNTVK